MADIAAIAEELGKLTVLEAAELVKKLEEELGVILFERSKAEVTITPIGATIVERAQRILEEVEGLRSAASEISEECA